MILIAPDKFKGTLTAQEAASIIAEALSGFMCIKAPMADGGEGTAKILCSGSEWQPRPIPGHTNGAYFVNRRTRTAVIDSSAVIGIKPGADLLMLSSAPLGILTREIIKGGCQRVIIGIGGTGVCDGGLGFLEGLGLDCYKSYARSIIGLSDVQVPLLPEYEGEPSALMFAPQKGATPLDMPVLARRLAEVKKDYAQFDSTPYDGAGGGLGFAIANAIGAECFPGAEYVLDHYNINWRDIHLVITGEGRIDSQTAQGKTISAVSQAAAAHGIPTIAIGGVVADDVNPSDIGCVKIISTSDFYPHLPLNKETAALRLKAAAENLCINLTTKN